MECTLYPSPTNTLKQQQMEPTYWVTLLLLPPASFSPHHNLCTSLEYAIWKKQKNKQAWLKALVCGGRMGLRKWRGGQEFKKYNKKPSRNRASRWPELQHQHQGRAGSIEDMLESWPPVSQDCFGKICCHTWGSRSFIWKAALRTANDQLKLDYFFPFVSQAAAPAPPAHLHEEGRHRAKKVLCSFFSSQSLLLLSSSRRSIFLSILCSSAYSWRLSVFETWAWAASSLRGNAAFGIWQSRFLWHILGSRHSGSSLLRLVIWFMA